MNDTSGSHDLLAWHPPFKVLAGERIDPTEGTHLEVLDIQGRTLASLGLCTRSSTEALAWRADGRMVAVACEEHLAFWEADERLNSENRRLCKLRKEDVPRSQPDDPVEAACERLGFPGLSHPNRKGRVPRKSAQRYATVTKKVGSPRQHARTLES